MALERFGPGTAPEEWRRYGHLHMQRYRFAMPHVGGKRVLDLACGLGYGSYALRTLGAREVVGADLSEEAITYARKNYVRAGLSYEIGNALTWKPPGALFDVVTSFETIEHLPDPPAFLQQVAQHLAPGGLLLLSTPNTLQHKRATPTRENKFHINEPDYATLVKWLESCFEVEGEWEQSPVIDWHAASLHRRFAGQERLLFLRVIGKVETFLRNLTASDSGSSAKFQEVVTDIQPLLPERRAACDTFLFVCRRKA